jgi:hypothetical protein
LKRNDLCNGYESAKKIVRECKLIVLSYRLCKWLIAVFLILFLICAFIPTAQATPLPELTTFSIVWISDTQNMVYHDFPGALESMGKWIIDNRYRENIKYVVQTGDAVDNGFCEWQWVNYHKLYDQFAGQIPFFVVAGNHELHVKFERWDAYLARPEISTIPRVNSFERGKAVYATFEVDGEKFLLIGAGYGAELESVDWMNSVLKYHPDYTAILLFHGYLKAHGEYLAIGEELFERVVKPNPNVRLVLCGHCTGNTSYRLEEIDDDGDGTPDRAVNALMYNYQDWVQDCGQLRLLTFDTATRSITVKTFSPYTGKEYRDDHFKAAEFTITNAF